MKTKEKITFEEHKIKTAEDCEALAEIIKEVATKVREGNMDAYEKFFINGGTNEGDAKLNELWDRLNLRYGVRTEMVA